MLRLNQSFDVVVVVVVVTLMMGRCHLLSYRGKRSIDYPAQGYPCNTLPPSERRDLWGVSPAVYGDTHADLPASLNKCLRNQVDVSLETARASAPIKRNVRSEIQTRVLDDVKCEGVT